MWYEYTITSRRGRGVSSTFPAKNMHTVAIICHNHHMHISTRMTRSSRTHCSYTRTVIYCLSCLKPLFHFLKMCNPDQGLEILTYLSFLLCDCRWKNRWQNTMAVAIVTWGLRFSSILVNSTNTKPIDNKTGSTNEGAYVVTNCCTCTTVP
jgi:hypothetical protein